MIRLTDTASLRVVTIDRPTRRNALRPSDLDALEAAVTDTDAAVVYLRGAGDAFCAGADLDVVAGVDGAARGGGVELALACDLRVATPDATFAEPGVKLGLFGAWGGTVRLSRVLREGDAMDFALSGRIVDAAEAKRIGLVSRVVSDPKTVAEEVAANEPDALAVVKARMRDDSPRQVQAAAEATAFDRLVRAHAADIAASRENE